MDAAERRAADKPQHQRGPHPFGSTGERKTRGGADQRAAEKNPAAVDPVGQARQHRNRGGVAGEIDPADPSRCAAAQPPRRGYLRSTAENVAIGTRFTIKANDIRAVDQVCPVAPVRRKRWFQRAAALSAEVSIRGRAGGPSRGWRIMMTSSTRPGTVIPRLTRKNSTQPSCSASQPPEADKMLTPDRRQRRQQRVLRRGKGDVAQPRQIGDKRGRPHAVGQVLGADRQRQHHDIVTGPDLHHVHQVRQRLQHAADQQRAEDAEPQHHDAAERDPGQRRDRRRRPWRSSATSTLVKPSDDVERVRHRAGERVAEFVEDR